MVSAKLVEHRSRQNELLTLLGIEPEPDSPVFLQVNQFGDLVRLNPSSLTQWWRRKRSKLGLANVRWHDLRHWGASRLIASGADIESVRNWLGHNTVNTTHGYIHLFGGDGRTELMQKAFGAFEAPDESGAGEADSHEQLGADDAARLLQIASTMLAGGTLDSAVAASVKQLLNAEDATT